MSYTIEIDADHDIALFRFWGAMDATEGRKAFLDYVGRPDFSAKATMITDARELASVDGTYPEILMKVMSLIPHLTKFEYGTMSVILVGDDLQLGMARVLRAVLEYCSPLKVIVVETPEEVFRLTDYHVTNLALLKLPRDPAIVC